MQTSFEGIWVPIISPFVDDDVDHAALARLARHLQASGIAGLVVGATTGEGALLRSGEPEAMFATLREAVPGMPIVLGVSQSATQAAVVQARRLSALGAEGLLATPPTYVRPTQDGIRRHFEAIVEAADLPVLIYNIPYRTGVNVEVDTLQALARDRRIVGIKECGGSTDRMFRLIHETPLRVLSGDDNQNFVALCLGAHGTIAASAHIAPELHVRMYRLIREGALHGARRLAVALQPIIRDLFAEPNPAPLKALLAQQEWCSNTLRLPFLPADVELARRLQSDWQTLGEVRTDCC
jgi:4-hydroxy-tetrahydrodipicolinate synthase